MNKNIAIHLAEGFEEIEAITIIDVLRRAEFRVITVSITKDYKVTGAHQIPIIADQLFDETNYNEIDMIILPGGMPGAKNLDSHSGLKEQILAFNRTNKPIGAICAAPLVFGNLGILANKEAVCYPGFEGYLKGAKIKNTPAIVSQNIITGRGVGAALNFSLKIVELLDGEDKANQLGKAMLVEEYL